jgi:hypothetical protein
MPLAPVQLDDLNWAQMVDAARRRIIAASAGAWTLHAPVDPGVTLLELFAWLLEQRVFLADQVTPELTRALLSLVGERTLPPTSAATVLGLESGKGAQAVGAGTELRLVSSRRAPLVFTTDASITVVSLTGPPEVRVNGVLRSGALGVAPIELTSSGQPMDVEIRLPLAAPLPTGGPGPLGLFLELDAGPVEGEWVPGEPRSVPPPSTVSFWRRDAHGALSRFERPALHDGTGGLRRSGLVRLPLGDWSPEPGPGAVYAFRLRCQDPAGYSFPPRLLRLEPNAVEAHHRWHVAPEPFHASWLPLAGAPELELPDGAGVVIPDSVRLELCERDGAWHDWTPVDRLAAKGPTDRVYLVDRDRGVIIFGDGVSGRMPVLLKPADEQVANVRLRYDAGGGETGDFAAGQRFEAARHPVRALSLVDSVGGTDEEALDAARDRAGEELHEVTRAVLPKDHEELATSTPGVGIERAHAAVGLHPAFSCLAVPGAVTLFIVPWAPRPTEPGDSPDWDESWVSAPQPDPGALAAVRTRLDAARLVASEIYVRGPRYRHVRLTVGLQGDPHDPAALRTAVTRRLRRFLDPLKGGVDGDGWPFGEPLRPSALLRQAQDAVGREADVVSVLVVLENAVPPLDCTDVDIGAHNLPQLDAVEVTLDRVVPLRGGLR